MPRFTESQTLETHKIGHFGFSAVPVDELEVAQVTLATIVCDRSTSTGSFQDEMEAAVSSTILALKGHAMSAQMLVRVVAFDNSIEEIHGFLPVESIDEKQYSGCLSPRGMTALFDACVSAIEATENYSSQLANSKFLNNAIVVVITDGWNNAGKFSDPSHVSKVRDSFESASKKETLESVATILVAVGAGSSRTELDAFHSDAGFTQPMLGVETATPDAIARVGKFVANSISSTSMSLGTGSPSMPIQF